MIKTHEAFDGIEMHIYDRTEFPALFGKAVKAAGGRYNDCRGHQHERYVVMPTKSWELATQIMRRFQPNTVILRGPTERYNDLCGARNSQWGRRAEDMVVRVAKNVPDVELLLQTAVEKRLAADPEASASSLRAEREYERAKMAREAEAARYQTRLENAAPALLAALRTLLAQTSNPEVQALVDSLERSA